MKKKKRIEDIEENENGSNNKEHLIYYSFETNDMGNGSWRIELTPDTMELANLNQDHHLSIPRDTGDFSFGVEPSLLWSKKTLIIKDKKQTYIFKPSKKDLREVISWLPYEIIEKTWKKDFQVAGGIFIVLGLIHFALAGFLDPTWGVVIICIGAINFLYSKPPMYIVNGMALIVVGLLNITTGFAIGVTMWATFGVFQLIWGVQIAQDFTLYKDAKELNSYPEQVPCQAPTAQDIFPN